MLLKSVAHPGFIFREGRLQRCPTRGRKFGIDIAQSQISTQNLPYIFWGRIGGLQLPKTPWVRY